jgi:predicted ArsR family transcriptional regulator
MTMRAHLQKLVDEGKVRTEPIRGEEVYEASVS